MAKIENTPSGESARLPDETKRQMAVQRLEKEAQKSFKRHRGIQAPTPLIEQGPKNA